MLDNYKLIQEPMTTNIQKNEWRKVSTSDAVKQTTNPIRNWIESYLGRVTPNATKKPLVFTVGDPSVYKGFETSTKCLEILSESIGEANGYTEPTGNSRTRKYLADLYSTDRCKLSERDVFMNPGCSGSLLVMNYALADPGDTVLLPRPGFPLMQAICEERNINIDTYAILPDKDWEIELQDLEEKLKKRPKFLLVNNPSNPLGATWSLEHIKDILRLANKYKVPILADEVYEQMVLPGLPIYSFGKLSEGQQPVFVCSGFAKMGLAPGWRVGWVVCYGKSDVIEPVREALTKICHFATHPTSTVQARLPELFDEATVHLAKKMQEIEDRVKQLNDAVEGCPGISVMKAKGAMYAVLVLQFDMFRDIKTSKDFAVKLYEEENVNTLPGALFGDDTFIRLVSLADGEYFKEFGIRLKEFVNRHLN